MALSIDFALADCLKNALHEMKHDNKYRALIAVIDQESIKLLKSFDHSENFADDLAKIRSTIVTEKVEACFIVIRLNDKEFGQVLMVPDTVKPKVRMLYASSSAHLRNASGLPIGSDTHATKVEELIPKLFDSSEEETREMMTESEKTKERLDALPVAPTGLAMAGVGCPLDAEAIKAAEAFAAGELRAATFTVNPSSIGVDKTFAKDAKTEDIIAGVPAEHPRYIALKWEEKTFLVYVCPSGIKPKERMPYASSKASFIAQMGDKNVKFERRLEIDDVKTLEESIAESLTEADFKNLPEATPTAPKAHAHKGPRMLI